ncbi:TPR domain protein [Penicillium longicatenatum]|uniref:TPR domain protein n=1 Tax=Penicillium longicatenatum TaxID=1561947 RepID=UPI00254775A2|nr:TPR domain protein [Penicillium longicatenatum]KAJ5639238.1 TPR domain protein [Penicillium longicatenatum]
MDQVLAIHELNCIRESTKGALRLAQKMAGIQKSEGLVNQALKISCRDASKYSLMLQNTYMALLWAEKGLEIDLYCLGKDYPEYQHMLRAVDVSPSDIASPDYSSEELR